MKTKPKKNEVIEDVEQEEVVAPLNGQELAVLQTQLGIGDEAIAKYEGQYMALTINGIEDVKGYEIAQKADWELVKTRTSLDKARKSINKPKETEIKRTNAEAKRLQAKLTVIEDHVKGIIRTVDNERKRIDHEHLRFLNERIEERIGLLREIEMRYVSRTDTWETTDEPILTIPAIDVRDLEDADFANIYSEIGSRFVQRRTEKELAQQEFERRERELQQKEEDLNRRLAALPPPEIVGTSAFRDMSKVDAEQLNFLSTGIDILPSTQQQPKFFGDTETAPPVVDEVPADEIDMRVILPLATGEQREELQKEYAELQAVTVGGYTDQEEDQRAMQLFLDSLQELGVPTMKTFSGKMTADVIEQHFEKLKEFTESQIRFI
ncbi:MAG TPA: hypothetical protein VGB67_00225 [Fibrella sp.]